MSLKPYVVSPALLALALAFGSEFAWADSKPALRTNESAAKVDPREGAEMTPSPALQVAIQAFMAQDRAAAFNYYLGHVNSFSTRPKPTVPDYAAALLRARGLSTDPRPNEKLPVVKSDKRRQDLDANLDRLLPVPYEQDAKPDTLDAGKAEDPPEGGTDIAKKYKRTQPARPIEAQKPLWVGPDEKERASEAAAVKPILLAFLQRHRMVFELGEDALQKGLPDLKQTGYSVGRYARKAVFEQSLNGEPVIGGKTIVLFDRNWNITAISRMIGTPSKLPVATSSTIAESEARTVTLEAVANRSQVPSAQWRISTAVLGIDPVRLKRIWVVSAKGTKAIDLDLKVKLDAATGEVLNISDNVDRYSDAKVRHWGYSAGNLEAPSQYVSDGFYTRDDYTLVHDFFHIGNDERGGGDPQVTCTETGKDSLWYEQAYGTTTGTSYVRPTRRGDRDFSLWYPSNLSGSFSESNSYYWARWFFQWMKGSISDLGELPASSADYPKVLIIANACISAGGLYTTNPVTTDQDQGEGIPVIMLPEKCRSDNVNCAAPDYTGFGTFETCEGNGCSTPPSVIHHEINHFLLKVYYDVLSDIDCSIGEQLKFLHEGILGSAVPQAYWHHYYGVGYNPLNTYLYKADYDAGLVHVDDASKITLSDYPCADSGDPYKSGRVAGQVMWEIYHGKDVNGAVISSMPRPATDRDFQVLTYWAAELVDASVYKDRYEMANRVMEIMENYSSLSATGKQQWCNAWGHHELGTWINSAYCS